MLGHSFAARRRLASVGVAILVGALMAGLGACTQGEQTA